MKLNELLYELSVGELSSLALSNDGDGTIRKKDMNKVLVAINSGLRDLYTKFIPEVTTEIITTTAETLYDLPTDCKTVLSVRLNSARMLPINDEELGRSVYVVNSKQLRIPELDEGSVLTVVYQPHAPSVCLDDLENELPILEVLVTPLKLFVAGTIFTNIGGSDANNKGGYFQQQYMGACAQLLGSDALGRSRFMNERFNLGGWV